MVPVVFYEIPKNANNAGGQNDIDQPGRRRNVITMGLLYGPKRTCRDPRLFVCFQELSGRGGFVSTPLLRRPEQRISCTWCKSGRVSFEIAAGKVAASTARGCRVVGRKARCYWASSRTF